MKNLDIKKEQRIAQCLYCGNKTLMNIVSDYQKRFDDGPGFSEYLHWLLLECPVCERISLLKRYTNDNFLVPYDDDPWEESIEYPRSSFSSKSVPQKVSSAFTSALKAQGDGALCLIALRRTLEAVCTDKQAEGKSLYNKIEFLTAKRFLPPVLNQASTLLRIMGNQAVHTADEFHNAHQINQFIEFTETIINYIYILPAKLKEIQDELENKESNDEVS